MRGSSSSLAQEAIGNQTSLWSLMFSRFISPCKILLITKANQDNLKLGQVSAFSLTKPNVIPPSRSAGGEYKCNMQLQEDNSSITSCFLTT